MSYVARIRKVATGEERAIRVNLDWEDHSSFWWSEGNYGCDCNRFLEFEYADGREPEDGEEEKCGEGSYIVVSITVPDGRVVYSEPVPIDG